MNNTTPFHEAAKMGLADIVWAFLEDKNDVNTKDQSGRTPLHFAAWHGHSDILIMLLEAGADVNARDIIGWSPLHYAAEHNRHDCIKILIQHEANFIARDDEGATFLHCAAMGSSFNRNSYDTLTVLLDCGMSVDLRDNIRWTPLHHAAKGRDHECIRILLEHGDDITVKK